MPTAGVTRWGRCADAIVVGATSECAPGLLCRSDVMHADCTGTCCTALCDLDAIDPNMACAGAMMGEMCLPLLEVEPANVGICGMPE